MKMIRNICIILIIMICVSFICEVSYAATLTPLEQTEEIIGFYNGTEANTVTGGGLDETRKIIGRIITIVQYFGVFIAVAMCISLGIKYMYSSPGDRAQIKNHLTVYIVGALVMFGATAILGIIKGFYEGIL